MDTWKLVFIFLIFGIFLYLNINQANAIIDDRDDLLVTYTGLRSPAMDIVSAGVVYDPKLRSVSFFGVSDGPIGTGSEIIHIFGINRGKGTERLSNGDNPSIGKGIFFDLALILWNNGTGQLNDFVSGSSVTLPKGTAIIKGSRIIVKDLPIRFFPSQGFDPENYTWNYWLRSGLGQSNQISDFVPNSHNTKVQLAPFPSTIDLIANPSLGNYLVDSKGMTLYYFAKDVYGNGACIDKCLDIWPIFYAPEVIVPSSLDIMDFNEITREDGNRQTTYRGHPLYYYVSDLKPGDIKGEGFNGFWYVAKQSYTVMIGSKDGLGNYLTDSSGKTLYYFTKDQASESNCYGDCPAKWPPFYAKTIDIPSTLNSKDFKSITRSDGSKQTTFKGWPLYYFQNDEKRGEANGQGVNNVWFIINPITQKPAITPPSLGFVWNAKTLYEGDRFEVKIIARNVTNMKKFIFRVAFDPRILWAEKAENGSFALWNPRPKYSGEYDLWKEPIVDNIAGFITFDCDSTRANGVSGTSYIANLTFETITSGKSLIEFREASVFDTNSKNIPIELGATEVRVIKYHPNDINQDGVVDILDFVITASKENKDNQIASIPVKSKLEQNHPNPFNPDTWLPYQLSQDSDVTIIIHDIFGKLIRTLDIGHQTAGFYKTKDRSAYWDGRNDLGEPVSSGIYFYTIQAGGFTDTKKMIVTK